MQQIYKVYVNGRLVKLFEAEDESVQYANAFTNLLTEGDFIYVIRESSEIIYEKRKEQNYVVG